MKVQARVYRSSQRKFYCKVLETGQTLYATALGKLLKKDRERIVVGDYVEIEERREGDYCIVSVEKRKNEIFRLLLRENQKKVIAANVDCLCIFTSVSQPHFKQGIVDRFLIRAHQWKLEPIIIFNKMDEYEPKKCKISYEAERLEPLGIKCFEISAQKGESYLRNYLPLGIKELKEFLRAKTSLLVGQSGVGKSKTVYSLSDGKVSLKTQRIGRVGKGIHTTTYSEIIELPEMTVIDSPGIKSFSLEDINPNHLLGYFPDLQVIASQCRFSNCVHDLKSQGCAFFHSSWGEEKREQILSRLHSYQKIREEISRIPQWDKKFSS